MTYTRFSFRIGNKTLSHIIQGAKGYKRRPDLLAYSAHASFELSLTLRLSPVLEYSRNRREQIEVTRYPRHNTRALSQREIRLGNFYATSSPVGEVLREHRAFDEPLRHPDCYSTYLHGLGLLHQRATHAALVAESHNRIGELRKSTFDCSSS